MNIKHTTVDEALLEEVLTLLSSYDSRSGQEHVTAEALVEWAVQHGLQGRVARVSPGRSSAILWIGSSDEDCDVLFSGHIDTLVPREELPEARVGRVDDRFYGPEVNNMKAAVAAMVVAMVQLARSDFAGRVTLLAAASECDTIGLGTVAALQEGLRARAAINGEPTNLAVLGAHAGVGRVRILTTGQGGHVSQSQSPASAIIALARIISALNSTVPGTEASARFAGMPSLNVGRISGGVAAATIAPLASAEVDMRWPPGTDFADITRRLRAYVDGVELPAGCGVDLEVLSAPDFLQPPAYEADRGWLPVQAVLQAHEEVMGRECVFGDLFPQVYFGSDAPHLVEAGIQTCIYGPGQVADINTEDESISWNDVVIACEVYKRAAYMLVGR